MKINQAAFAGAPAPRPVSLPRREARTNSSFSFYKHVYYGLLDGQTRPRKTMTRVLRNSPIGLGGPSCSTTTRAQSGAHRAVRSTGQTEGLTPDDVLDNVHAVLANQHRGFRQLASIGRISSRFFHSQGRQSPNCREASSPDELYQTPRKLGGAGPIPISSTTTRSKRAVISLPWEQPKLFTEEVSRGPSDHLRQISNSSVSRGLGAQIAKRRAESMGLRTFSFSYAPEVRGTALVVGVIAHSAHNARSRHFRG